MKEWQLIVKDPQKQPATGSYSDWKEQIAEECFFRCVYCGIHEHPWGGIDHYHIDHLRPKHKAEFQHLINDICNLFYACPICNKFKGKDWPAEPDLDVPCYPDPSITNYSELFEIDMEDFNLIGLKVASEYLIQRLYLNRPQLIYERRETFLKQKGIQLTKEIAAISHHVNDEELKNRVIDAITAITDHLHKRERIRPYKLSEIRKQ